MKPEHIFLMRGAEADELLVTISLDVHSTAVLVRDDTSGKRFSSLFWELLRFDLGPNSLFVILSTLRSVSWL